MEDFSKTGMRFDENENVSEIKSMPSGPNAQPQLSNLEDADITKTPYVLARPDDSIVGDADTLGERTIAKPKYGKKIPSDLKKVLLKQHFDPIAEDSVNFDINLINSKIEHRKQDEEWNMVDQIVDAELRVANRQETSNLSEDYNEEKGDLTMDLGQHDSNHQVVGGTEGPDVDLSGIGFEMKSPKKPSSKVKKSNFFQK